jgi:hypothetical protein
MGNGLFWNNIATLISCASFTPSGAVERLLWEDTYTFVITVASGIIGTILAAIAIVLSVKTLRRSNGSRLDNNSLLTVLTTTWYSLYHTSSMNFALPIPGNSMPCSCKPHGRPSMTLVGIANTWGRRPAQLWCYTPGEVTSASILTLIV